MKRHQTNQVEEHSTKQLAWSLQPFKVKKHKEMLKNYPKLDTKKMWQLNAMQGFVFDLEWEQSINYTGIY